MLEESKGEYAMQPIEIRLSLEEYTSSAELPEADRVLLEKAALALEKAYAPYSKFRVGAAARLADGTVVPGNNQENVAYPSGLCAERVAVFTAGAQFPNMKIAAMAVIASSSKFLVDYPISPCGACRQALLEYEVRQKDPIRLILSGREGKIWIIPSVSTLLPLAFQEDSLKLD